MNLALANSFAAKVWHDFVSPGCDSRDLNLEGSLHPENGQDIGLPDSAGKKYKMPGEI